MNKPRRFRLHFNRIAMQRGDERVWTIHLSDRCIPAVNVLVRVPLKTTFRPEGQQPRAWFEGRGDIIAVSGQKDCYVIV